MIKMSNMKKKMWSKLKLQFGKKGGHGNEQDVNEPNVNEEYKQAFRTKSYIDMCNKVHDQKQVRAILEDEGQFLSSSSSSSSLSSTVSSPPPSPRIQDVHICQYLVEPRQETLTALSETSELHQFIVNYFEISLDAGKTCELILQNFLQVHIDYRAIKDVIKLIKRVPDRESWTQNQLHAVRRNLASYATCNNPFSKMTTEKFHELHSSHSNLLHQLRTQCRNTERKIKFIRFIKRTLTTFLAFGLGASAIALLVLAIHSIIGLVAAPPLIVFSLAFSKMKKLKRKFDKKWLDGLEVQLDEAARGVYTLIRDFDTLSTMVQTVCDEMERRKYVAENCVRNEKNAMLKEVVTQFQMHDSCFLEKLEELERHIYLCFLDINRSRRLVVDKMVKG